MQLPIWKAASNTEKNVEKRIDGAPSFNWINSLVWTYSHQVAGIAKGPNFDVKGPGLFFINKNERPFEIVDLRNQTRNSTIKAISRDGIPFEANTHISFCIDHEIWTREQYHELRRTNIIQGREPDANLQGDFPYSRGRVKAVKQ